MITWSETVLIFGFSYLVIKFIVYPVVLCFITLLLE